jgi:acetoin utilization deacetylase AcuC-like enzyme
MAGGLPAASYVDALRRGIDEAARGFVPDLVLVSCGFDSLQGDPLGGFTLELEDVYALTRYVCDVAGGAARGRVVAALEGGYVPERIGAGAVAVMRALGGDPLTPEG